MYQDNHNYSVNLKDNNRRVTCLMCGSVAILDSQKNYKRVYRCKNPKCKNPPITLIVPKVKKEPKRHYTLLEIPESPSSAVKKIRKLLSHITSCELCGYNRALQGCHIIPKRHGGHYTLDNILILCPNCHWCLDHNLLTSDEKIKLESVIKSRST